MGEDILLFDTDTQAFEQIMRLKSDFELRERLGRNARRRMEQMYSQANVASERDYYLK